MKSHIEHIQDWMSDILDKEMLDVGSGKGSILIEVAKKGGRAVGIEPSAKYISIARDRAREAGVSIDVRQGVGEQLPFAEGEFDFVNLTEVIEHVRDPIAVLKEVHRVVRPRGQVYMSVPNRYGFEDHHFKMYFVNWLPRSLAPHVIGLFGKHKDYSDSSIGLQRLDEMHYYTFGGIRKVARSIGFEVHDIRIEKIARLYPSWILRVVVLFAYYIARTIYLESFHVRLVKA